MVGRRIANIRWEYTSQEKGSPRAKAALKIVLALGGLVFLVSCSAAAQELVRTAAVGAVTLFWMAWSLSAAALALLLLKTSR